MHLNLTFEKLNNNGLKKILNALGKSMTSEVENPVDEILNKSLLYKLNLQQGIIYNFDSIEIGNLENLRLDKENIMEARFFNEKMEITLFNNGEAFEGNIILEGDEKEHAIKEEYFIYNQKNIDKIQVKKYIDFDEDNQAYIFYVKPCKLL